MTHDNPETPIGTWRRIRDLSRERESSEQFVWYGETEMQLRRWAIMLSIQANWHQDEGI
jgi:hypothetical protein